MKNIIWCIKFTKTAWIGIKTANKLLLLGTMSPRPHSHPVSVFTEIEIFLFQSFKKESYMVVSMLSNPVL